MFRLRSWMFVPGNSLKMITKSFGLDLDVAMLDVEDGVVPELKAEARTLVAEALAWPKERVNPLRYVRVNAIDTGELQADLDAVVVPGLDGIVLPKTETIENVHQVAAMLDDLEEQRGMPSGGVKVVLALESAKALIAAPDLATASSRVAGLCFGAEDYSKDLGLSVVRTGVARDFTYARSAIVVAATAARIASIDGVWPELSDSKALHQDSVVARDLGFTGKSMIHPGQLAIINEVFSPTDDEIAYAEDLVADFKIASREGRGSISFRGQLVDLPIYERALRTIAAGTRTKQMERVK